MDKIKMDNFSRKRKGIQSIKEIAKILIKLRRKGIERVLNY